MDGMPWNPSADRSVMRVGVAFGRFLKCTNPGVPMDTGDFCVWQQFRTLLRNTGWQAEDADSMWLDMLKLFEPLSEYEGNNGYRCNSALGFIT